jgi:DNA-binding NtrC family response regulator
LHFFFFAMRYLIVDADRNFREALAIALRLEGHEVWAVSDANPALAQLELGGLSCCVADWSVERIDEVLELATRAGVRTIVTGIHPALVDSTARRHPRAEALPKPFQAEELLAGEHR